MSMVWILQSKDTECKFVKKKKKKKKKKKAKRTHIDWKHKINGNHPIQKGKEEKRNKESTGKQGLKW